MTNALIRHIPAAPETPAFRSPPHNIEAEQALLGAILVNNEAIDRVSSFLKPVHFFEPLHGRIYETDPNNLGAYVFRDFVRNRRKRLH